MKYVSTRIIYVIVLGISKLCNYDDEGLMVVVDKPLK